MMTAAERLHFRRCRFLAWEGRCTDFNRCQVARLVSIVGKMTIFRSNQIVRSSEHGKQKQFAFADSVVQRFVCASDTNVIEGDGRLECCPK